MTNVTIVVRKLVSASGLDIREISVAIHASQQSIYKWMSGKSNPDCAHLLGLIKLVSQVKGPDETIKGL